MQQYFHTPKGMFPGKSGGWLRAIDFDAATERQKAAQAEERSRLKEEIAQLRAEVKQVEANAAEALQAAEARRDEALEESNDRFNAALAAVQSRRDQARSVADSLGAVLENATGGKGSLARIALNAWMRERSMRREG